MTNALDIECALARYFDPRRNLIVPNVWWGMGLNHECDVLVMTRIGYLYEVEIKTSKADLVRDLKKPHAHNSSKIRKLYFCVTEPLLEYQNLIPERAGIILFKTVEGHNYCYKKREAKLNPCRPLDTEEREKLYQLAAMRVWTLKRKLKSIMTKNETLD